jgi:thymidylate synthase (FAD)
VNTVEPYARIMDLGHREDGIALLRKIEWCGRISHRSEDKQDPFSWERFVKAVVLEHGDWSIVEHVGVSVDFLVDRGITHEIVRHRLFSFTQESTRFVNYEKKMPPSFVEPPGLSDEAERAPNGEAVETSTRQQWRHAISTAESMYKRLLSKGIAPQIARSVFPNALASRLIVTGNLRNWRHFLIMRTTKEAHPQMRQVTIPLLAEFQAKIPILFDDIEPLSKQSEGTRRGR